MNKKAKIIAALGLMGVLFMGTGMNQADAKKKAPAQTEQQVKDALLTYQVMSLVCGAMLVVFAGNIICYWLHK